MRGTRRWGATLENITFVTLTETLCYTVNNRGTLVNATPHRHRGAQVDDFLISSKILLFVLQFIKYEFC
jgi:hypothetical protein